MKRLVDEELRKLRTSLQFWATLSKCFNWWVYLIMIGGIISLTVNRFTAFVWPMKYKQVGERGSAEIDCNAQDVVEANLLLGDCRVLGTAVAVRIHDAAPTRTLTHR